MILLTLINVSLVTLLVAQLLHFLKADGSLHLGELAESALNQLKQTNSPSLSKSIRYVSLFSKLRVMRPKPVSNLNDTRPLAVQNEHLFQLYSYPCQPLLFLNGMENTVLNHCGGLLSSLHLAWIVTAIRLDPKIHTKYMMELGKTGDIERLIEQAPEMITAL